MDLKWSSFHIHTLTSHQMLATSGKVCLWPISVNEENPERADGGRLPADGVMQPPMK